MRAVTASTMNAYRSAFDPKSGGGPGYGLSLVESAIRLSRPPAEVQAETAAEKLPQILRARRERGRFLGHDLFADPAWDILLELFAAEADGRKISVSGVCASAALSATTGLRWLGKLERAGLVVRHSDPLDRRRSWVHLSPTAIAALQHYFATFASGAW